MRLPVWKKLVFTTVVAAAALLLCEGGLVLSGFYYSPFSLETKGGVGDWRLQHVYEDPRFVYDPVLIWRPRPNRSVFNSQGFRGPELAPHKADDEFRIFVLGDSNTIGHLGDKSDKQHGANWPQYLPEHLHVPGKRIVVVNAGVWGYTSFQGVGRLQQVLPYQPDLVLVCFGANDAHRVIVPDAEFNAAVFRGPLFRTRTGQLIKAAWDKALRRTREADDSEFGFRVSVDEYRENLNTMIRMCREHGVLCVLVTRPFVEDEPCEASWWRASAPEYVKATLEVGRSAGVLAIDVNHHFENQLPLFVDESHFSEEGHKAAAEFIGKKLDEYLRQRP